MSKQFAREQIINSKLSVMVALYQFKQKKTKQFIATNEIQQVWRQGTTMGAKVWAILIKYMNIFKENIKKNNWILQK